MEFKQEELIEREIKIAGYLGQDLSLNHISITTGLSKKLLVTHTRNMMIKLKIKDMHELIQLIRKKGF